MTRSLEKAFRQAASRHGRRKTGRSLCEGTRCCAELLAQRPESVNAVLLSEDFSQAQLHHRVLELTCPVETLPRSSLAALASTETPQGIVALFTPPATVPLPEGPLEAPFLLVLDGLADPGNLGTILRTAWAVGLRHVCLTAGSTDAYGPKAIRAGMGAQFAVTLCRCSSLLEVKSAVASWGWGPVWLAVPQGGATAFGEAFSLAQSALVIGGEAQGISDLTAGCPVSLPMPGAAESLNAAQAATVFLFDAVRRGLL